MHFRVVIGLLTVLWFTGCGAYMKLDGDITRVRVVETGGPRNVLVVEFQARNNARVGYIVKEAEVDVSDGSGVTTGETVAARDAMSLCQHMASLSGDCAEPLLTRQTIAPGETVTRMVMASFALSPEELRDRKQLTLRVRELDRLETAFREKP